MIFSAILGVVQGLTEFLPVSSSAHLILVSSLHDGKALSLALNTALHFGTLIAVLLYFRQDWLKMAASVFQLFRYRKRSFDANVLFPSLVLASVPAGFLGILGKDAIEQIFHNPLWTAFPLFAVGILLWLVDKWSRVAGGLEQLNFRKAIMIGLAQACALIPGVSRSGATISCARALGFDRVAAARFSFLLGTPAMGGAALLHYQDFLLSLGDPSFYIGVGSSCVTGCFAIRLFMGFVARFGFFPFALYRAVLALVIIALFMP